MALFSKQPNETSETQPKINHYLSKQPVILLFAEVIAVLLIIFLVAPHSCSEYEQVLQEANYNIMSADKVESLNE